MMQAKEPPGVFDFTTEEDLLADPASILAFVLPDDPGVYVCEGYVPTVAKRMKAEIDGDGLVFQENGRRIRRGVNLVPPPPLPDPWYPRVMIAVWHFRRGMICTRYAAGDWLRVVDRRGRTKSWYQLQEDSNWCVRAENAECAIALTTVEGDFYHDGPGDGDPTRETHRLPKCWR